jgi:hypothetical protein
MPVYCHHLIPTKSSTIFSDLKIEFSFFVPIELCIYAVVIDALYPSKRVNPSQGGAQAHGSRTRDGLAAGEKKKNT